MKRVLLSVGILFLLFTSLVLLIAMGFFNRLFPGKTNQTASHSSPSHQEDWAAYLTTIENDKVGSIVVDLGLKKAAPISTKLNRLRIDIKIKNPRPNGLPSDPEFGILGEIDDRLSSDLKINNGAVFAGHLFCEGMMSLYLYISDETSFKETVSEAMSHYPDYAYTSKVDREEKWESYNDFLYPLPIQMQSIQNGRVVENISSQGDSLKKERNVVHWIYFKKEADRERFIASLEGLDFTVESKHKTSVGDSTFVLQLSRHDKVDHQSVDSYTLDLWQKANDAGGEYDGWETEVVRD